MELALAGTSISCIKWLRLLAEGQWSYGQLKTLHVMLRELTYEQRIDVK
jgi:hypothetical protein